MATRTLTALFDRYEDAAAAVGRLEAAGVSRDDISLLSNDAGHAQYYGAIPGDAEPMPDASVAGTGAGASLGSLIGGGAGLLAGLGMLAIPGLGPVVAAGWLASTLLGAGVGAAAGGLVGSLTDIGVAETDAHAYAEGLHRGGTLLTERADAASAERVGALLDQDSAIAMPEREGAWRESGWAGRYTGGVTGAPVFTDPTMLGPAAMRPPAVSAATPVADPLGGEAPPTAAAADERQSAIRRPAAGNSRVRIYDNG